MIYRNLVVIVFLCFSQLTSATNDSLIALYKKQLDTAKGGIRIQLMLQLAQQYQNNYPDSSIFWLEKIIAIGENNNDKKAISVAYGSMAVVAYYQGNYEQAISYANQSADLELEQERYDKFIGQRLNIGVYFESLNQDEKARDIYKEIENLINEYPVDSGTIANLYNNKALLDANTCENEKDPAYCFKAIRDYRKVLEIDQHYKYRQGSVKTLNNIGNAYNDIFIFTKDKQYADSALKYLKLSAEARTDFEGLSYTYSNIGLVYSLLEDHNKSIDYRLRALDFARKGKFKPAEANALEELAFEYVQRKEFKKAFDYLLRAKELKDSLLDAQTAERIAELETQFDVERKARENQRLKADNAQSELDLARSTNQRNLLIGSLLLLSFISGSGFISYRQRQKAKFEKDKRNQQQLRFKAVIEAEEKERTRIARELHDGLGQLLSVAKLTLGRAQLEDKNEQERINSAKEIIDETATELRSISHNMMPYILMEEGIHAALDQLKEKINQAGLLNIKLDNKLKTVEINSSASIALYRIVQEVINNMIKHSQARNIQISLFENKSRIQLVIIDDGVGFDTTVIEQSEGIGWKNIINRVVTLNGRINVDSKPGKGTQVNIALQL